MELRWLNLIYVGIIFLLLHIESKGEDDENFQECSKNQLPLSNIINSLSNKISNRIQGYDNYFISPLSISVALAMVYIGTRGKTKKQMTNALDYQKIGKGCLLMDVPMNFKQFIESLERESENTTLQIANGAFIQSGYNVASDYKNKLKLFFHSDLFALDFANEELVTMKEINRWVKNNTNGKIEKILSEPLEPMTVMILLNAIYFKSLWQYPFQEEDNWRGTFYGKNSTNKTISFMIQQNYANYCADEENGYSFLELDYAGGEISMLIALPEQTNVFPKLEMTSSMLCKVRRCLQLKEVMIGLPKFKLSYLRELSKDMISFGIEELFSDRADLTGIRHQNDLHVSLMIHKAMIETNEKGSEASAVSGIGIDGRKKTEKSRMFWADHPFLFYIIDKKSDTILFMGRVSDPEY